MLLVCASSCVLVVPRSKICTFENSGLPLFTFVVDLVDTAWYVLPRNNEHIRPLFWVLVAGVFIVFGLYFCLDIQKVARYGV